MSLSTYVIGFRPPDERWQQMKAVYEANAAAGLRQPTEVEMFFLNGAPDASGVEVNLDNIAKEWRDDSRDGIEIDIRDLPPEVHILRFVNSW